MVRDDHERHVDEMRERVKTCETSTGEHMTMVYPIIFCDDAISRLNKIRQIIAIPNTIIQEDVMKYKMICEVMKDELPSVTHKSGKWINDKDDMPTCSECGYIPPYSTAIDDYEYSNYCPNCGVKMVEPQEKEQTE